ncbi:hypothetical protein CAP39_08715 [Sphingomonas sp. IBVSS1]|nr:hypothetical protein CAP39_08715 [Sphingomonas sp. IBVSS1]
MPPGPAGNLNLGMVRPLSRGGGPPLRPQLDALFRDVLAVGDAARGWFDGPCLAWRATLAPDAALAVGTESLAVTAGLLAVMNWLLRPEHQGQPQQLQPFRFDDPPPLAADHPLTGTPGHAIATATRQILARAEALSALNAPPEGHEP